MEYIAIDLGSNTLRVISRDCQNGEFVQEFERMVKTADNLHASGRISAEAVDRIITALLEADRRMDFSTKKVFAVTTAAMRMAHNSQAVITEIFKATGVLFEIIDAQQEAYLTHLAVSQRMQTLGYKDEAFFLLDVGGGSTEVIYSFKEHFISKSIDVGIVTMSQKHTTKDALVQAMYEAFKPLHDFKQKAESSQKAAILVATAGTPTTMASLKQGMTVESYDAKKINGTQLTLDDLSQGLDRLLAMDERDRARFVGVGRDILIIAGVEILKVLYDVLGFDSAVVIDDGLREGLAIERCKAML